MQKPVESDHDYVVHLFEMESPAYNNMALTGNDEYFSENWTTLRSLDKGRENSVPPSGDVGHCAKTPGRHLLLKNVGRDKEETLEEQPQQFYRIPHVLSPAEKKFYKTANCSVKRLTNNHVYNNAVNRQKRKKWEAKGEKSDREEAKLDLPTGLKCAEKQRKTKCCGRREIACLQVLTLLMAAAGLTLVVMIIGGKITCLPESLKGMKLISYL